MKIRTCRMSGRPVDPEAGKAYDAEWTAGYLELERKHRVPNSNPDALGFYPVNVLAIQPDADELEKSLKEKYQATGEAELPVTIEAWGELIKAIGSPLMLANPIDKPDDIVLVIMDTPLG